MCGGWIRLILNSKYFVWWMGLDLNYVRWMDLDLMCGWWIGFNYDSMVGSIEFNCKFKTMVFKISRSDKISHWRIINFDDECWWRGIFFFLMTTVCVRCSMFAQNLRAAKPILQIFPPEFVWWGERHMIDFWFFTAI